MVDMQTYVKGEIVMIIALLLLFQVEDVASCRAIEYCMMPPAEPVCLITGFNGDEYMFRACKYDVERYLEELQEWINCNNRNAEMFAREARKAENEAISVAADTRRKADEVVAKFNCYASGNSYC